jgi:PAS domain S-box-containing protein
MASILLADDHADERHHLRVLLEAAGHRVVEASDGSEALALAHRDLPDLILADVVLPAMDGFDLCRRWRLDPALCCIPFVFRSALGADDRERELAGKLGADDFLVGPCASEDLLGRIDRVLARTAENGDRPVPTPLEEQAFRALRDDVLRQKLIRNLGELRESNRRLAQGEERLRLVLEAGAHGTYDLDLPSGAAVVNDAYAAMLGHGPGDFEETFDAFFERMHPDDRDACRRALDDYLAGRRPEYRSEFRLRTADGGWKWILSTGAVVEWGPDHTPIRFLGTHTDIDDRMRASRVLWANAERMDTLLALSAGSEEIAEDVLLEHAVGLAIRVTESATGCVHVFDTEGTLPRVSLWLRQTGEGLRRCPPPSELDGLWEACRRSGAVIGKDRLDPGGRSSLFVPVKDGGEVRLVLGVLDTGESYDAIDEQQMALTAAHLWRMLAERRARRRRAEAEGLYRAVAEQSIAGLVVVDGGTLLYANPRTEEIFGMDRDDIVGRPWIDLLDEGEDRDAILESIAEVQYGDAPSLRSAFRFRRADGTVIRLGTHSTRAHLDDRPVVLSVIQDITDRLRHEEERQEQMERLRRTMLGAVNAMSRMIEVRDPYTSGHERRVGDLAGAIGARIGLDDQTVESLRIMGYVHDVGKIVAPAEVLSKPGPLTRPEFQIIKAHADEGYQILKGIDFPWPVAEAVRQHHERLNGSGYPRGLEGEAIIREARILAVADVVEAMASHRPYRPALGLDAALDEIAAGAGVTYDAEVAAACIALFREDGYRMG